MVSQISPLMEDLIHVNIALTFWMAQLLVPTVLAAVTSAYVTEWYSVSIFFPATSMIFVGSGVSVLCVLVVPAVSHFPSLAWIQKDTTQEGNMDTFPSQMLSRGVETVTYADDPERKERSNRSAEENGSNNLGGWGGACCMLLVTATSNATAFARAALFAMLTATSSWSALGSRVKNVWFMLVPLKLRHNIFQSRLYLPVTFSS